MMNHINLDWIKAMLKGMHGWSGRNRNNFLALIVLPVLWLGLLPGISYGQTATAPIDTVLVLVETVEDLEMELKLAKIRENVLIEKVEELTPSTFEKIISDPRVWFIFGAYLGAQAVR